MAKLRYKIDSVQIRTDKNNNQMVTKILKQEFVQKPCKECGNEPKLPGSSRGANCKKLNQAKKMAAQKLENYRNKKR